MPKWGAFLRLNVVGRSAMLYKNNKMMHYNGALCVVMVQLFSGPMLKNCN